MHSLWKSALTYVHMSKKRGILPLSRKLSWKTCALVKRAADLMCATTWPGKQAGKKSNFNEITQKE